MVKAMKHQWANQLVIAGSMRFRSLEYYRKWENAVLGDPNDGEGLFHMNAHPFAVGSSNPVYAWCASLPEITVERLLDLAKHGKYDCIVRIREPEVLLQRVRLALRQKADELLLHCGEVFYDRGNEVDKETLNSQKFHFNVFQKSPRFMQDREYRMSLTDVSVRPNPREYVDLLVGDCSDIMDIEELPTRANPPDGLSNDAALAKWVRAGADYAATLPGKR